MLVTILLISLIVFALGYCLYGRFLCRRCEVDDARETPAVEKNDGVDYVPTRASLVFGHHFSSIAGAGPIVGPILATMYFGWGPTWLWILVGALFFGGVHDFGSLLMSLRYRGRTITEITKSLVGPQTGVFFRVFLLLALIYVIIVFLDLTAGTFASAPSVATASGWFIMCAVAFGQVLRWKGLPWSVTLMIFIPLTFVGLLAGHYLPAEGISKSSWLTLIVIYCFVAAVLPVNVLLQPRDFLSSIFLYAMMLLGIVGLLFSGRTLQAPVFIGLSGDGASPLYLFPVLFITVACGACSGFHSLVASGTTSKQVERESDVKPVAYGGMLVEGLLAVFALASIAILSQGDIEGKKPVEIFATGAAVFMNSLHIPQEWGREFTALTVSTFLLTTLDTCTRLARFILSEMFSWEGGTARYLGTLGVILVPAFVAVQDFNGVPAWQALWPLFGATNQMMAGLALITFIVFLKDRRMGYRFALIPAIFMMISPLTALVFMAMNFSTENWLIPTISVAMFILGFFVAGMSLKFVFFDETQQPSSAPVS
ncbi:carbon starvation CstA family protein [Cerasicoccus maritimus]|uniref:carbon starvation CstA family protein n=1 Tax=Cerasicoccus maritimus TaxID=490089 RepID=UPI00285299AB|nr:carbon starvation protein A [Cerasicoccus maritimus]